MSLDFWKVTTIPLCSTNFTIAKMNSSHFWKLNSAKCQKRVLYSIRNNQHITEQTLIKILAVPLFRILGSRREYIIRIGFPLTLEKLSNSIALAAVDF